MLRQVFQADVDDHAEEGLSNHCLINFPNRKGGTRKLIRHFLDIGASLVKELEDVLLH